MNHETARELLLDRSYGELPPERARELEAHLASCSGCRADAERIEATRAAMRRLGPEPEPGGEGILLAAAREAAGKGRPRRFSWLGLSLAAGAAATVAVAIVSMWPPREAERAEEEWAARLPPPAAGAFRAAPPAPAPAAPEAKAAPAVLAARPAAKALAAAPPPPAGEAAKAEAPGEPKEAGTATVERAAAPAGLAGAEQSGEALVRELRARREAGELNEARRHPDPCPGGDTERLAWLDGWGKAHRFARTGPAPGGGTATRDHYYDDAGRARVVIVDGDGPSGHYRRRILFDARGRRIGEDPPGLPPWPASDLALRDGAAAFWAPQRCGE